MHVSYIEKYTILQTFQNNDRQTVFIGTVKDQEDEIVIINLLKDLEDLWQRDQEKLQKSLGNLLHWERMEEGLVLVTAFKDAQPLEGYLQQNHVGIHKRVNMIFAYLRDLVKYKELSYPLQSMMIDAAQILVDNHQIFFSELILLDKNLQLDHTFEGLTKKIAAVMEKILTVGASEEEENRDILAFIHRLWRGEHSYKDTEEIYNAFRSYYLYQWAMGNQPREARKKSSLAEDSVSSRTRAKTAGKKRVLPRTILLVAALGVGAFGLSKFIHQESKIKEASLEPAAYFERVETQEGWAFINKSTAENLEQSIWEITKDDVLLERTKTKDIILPSPKAGSYHISLRVQGNNGKWSEPYVEVISMEGSPREVPAAEEEAPAPVQEMERLAMFQLDYDTAQGVSLDHDHYKSGRYSIRVEGAMDSQRKIQLKELSARDQSVFSMWMMTDTEAPVKIRLKGMRKNRIVFEKNILHQPSRAYLWELLNIEGGLDAIDNLEMLFSTPSILWLDDMELDSFK